MNLKRALGGFLLSFVFLLVFVYIIFGAQLFFENYFQNQNKETFLGSAANGVQNITQKTANVLEINAELAISVESDLSDLDKIIFEKASDEKLPIASLTKLMTAVIVLDNYNLSENVTVDKIADLQDPMKQDVKLGDTMPIENFLEIMLVELSNKSAYVLSEKMGAPAFVNLMNQKAKDIGLENTFFADPTGLSSQNISTASDLAKLAEYILKNYPRIADISKQNKFYVPDFGEITNTDQLLGEIPEVVCSKTGFTTQAKGCLLLVINNPKNNDYIINIILGADDKFSEMQKLINFCK